MTPVTGTRLGNGDHTENIGHVVHAGTAYSVGTANTHDAHFAELAADFFRMAMCVIKLSGDGFDLGSANFVTWSFTICCSSVIQNS